MSSKQHAHQRTALAFAVMLASSSPLNERRSRSTSEVVLAAMESRTGASPYLSPCRFWLALILASIIPGMDSPASAQTALTGRCGKLAIPQFTDVTAQAGIRFQHASDPTKRYISESMSGGVVLLDFDGDGWLDIYFTNAPTVAMMQRGERARGALYRNNHNGTFSDVTDKAGVGYPCAAMGGAVGDFNNDGWPDLYISCLHGGVLYRNNGDGTFSDVSAKAGVSNGRWSTGAAFADYDSDGLLDLAVSSYVMLDFDHLREPGSASTCMYRSVEVQCGPHGLEPARNSLFHNRGDGHFDDVSAVMGIAKQPAYYGLGLLWADFDGSGHPSLFIADDSTPNLLYRNTGHGEFTEMALEAGVAFNRDGKEQANMGVAAGDYLHTGVQSLRITTFSDEVKPLYRNDGNWVFSEVASSSGLNGASFPLLGWGTAFADFNNDGWLDLLTVYGHVYPQADTMAGSAGYREPKLLSMNSGNSTFCDGSQQAGPAISTRSAARGLAVGDLFNNGAVDAVIENIDGTPMVLRNEGITGTHWVEFELAGTQSNRSAIGAEVKVQAGPITQTAEVRSGSSYLSQNDLRVHFGLAAAVTVDKIEIRWPSGRRETLTHLAADKIYSVLEGQGIVDGSRLHSTGAKLERSITASP